MKREGDSTSDVEPGNLTREQNEILTNEHFLAEASKVLGDSIDYQTTLRRVARLAVPLLADFSIVDVVDEDGELRRVAAVHVDPTKDTLAREAMRFLPDARLEGHPVNRAIRTRQSQIISVAEEALRSSGSSDEHAELMRRIGAETVLVVPMIARGHPVGAIQFITIAGGSEREYDAAQVGVAEELSRRAAIAIDNARLYAEAQRRAREERALREAVTALSKPLTTEDVIQQIAISSVDATAADGAFVTWIYGDSGEVEVVARAGDIPPPFAARVAYSDSYTRKVTELKEPVVIRRLDEFEGPLRDGPLARGFPDWSALVVPLDPRLPIGALFLLRRPERPVFSDEEISRAHTFGGLAAMAFHKLQLLEQSEGRLDALEHISASRARLMRGFSHDVKNPLGAADGHAQLLEDGILGELSDEQRASVARIRSSIHVSLRLIQDLLELARAESGQIQIERAPTDVSALLREVCEDYRAQATASGLQLDCRAENAARIETDAVRVRQILSNLLSNALKYTPTGGVSADAHMRTDISPAHSGEWVAVEVTDTGTGIAEEKLERIFQEFTRLDPDAKPGAGVGLAISRRIARLMGGDITVKSTLGHGSTFTLWLPRFPTGAPTVLPAAGNQPR